MINSNKSWMRYSFGEIITYANKEYRYIYSIGNNDYVFDIEKISLFCLEHVQINSNISK